MTEELEDGPRSIEDRLASIEHDIRLLISATGTKVKERPDGSRAVKSRLLKLDWKFAVSVLGAASGIGFAYKVLAPAVIDFFVAVHHALLQ